MQEPCQTLIKKFGFLRSSQAYRGLFLWKRRVKICFWPNNLWTNFFLCDFKKPNSPFSNWKQYLSGKRSTFRLTAWFIALVSTPYNVAISRSSRTCLPRTIWIIFSTPDSTSGFGTELSVFSVFLAFFYSNPPTSKKRRGKVFSMQIYIPRMSHYDNRRFSRKFWQFWGKLTPAGGWNLLVCKRLFAKWKKFMKQYFPTRRIAIFYITSK